MIRDRLVPGASWLELAPDSATFQTAPAELGWSMRHLRIVVATSDEGDWRATPR